MRPIILPWLILPFLFLSCDRDFEVTASGGLSLFAFLVADNDLDDHADYIEKDLVRGLKGCPVGTELFLYEDRRDEPPTLRQFVLAESGQVAFRHIARFDEQCSASADLFMQVLSTMQSGASGSSYGLLYWSHGNGWLPGANIDSCSHLGTKSIGLDSQCSMYVEDMAAAIGKTGKIPAFLLLDACFMGGVEVAYALRNSADYLISSPSETLGICFPYHLILPLLVNGDMKSMKESLDVFYSYCLSDYYGDGTLSGMASLTDCGQMDALASSFRDLNESFAGFVQTDSIQAFDCFPRHLYYDLYDYCSHMSSDSLLLSRFQDQLCRTVLHSVTTPSVFTQTAGRDSMLVIGQCCGLSTYIPGTGAGYDWAYSQTEWYRYCYGK